jgi:hypothetical protein
MRSMCVFLLGRSTVVQYIQYVQLKSVSGGVGGSEGALPRPPLPFPYVADLLASALGTTINTCHRH